MDEKLCNCDCNDENDRLSLIEKMMSILDEDGQPIYDLEWLEEHLGITQKENLD